MDQELKEKLTKLKADTPVKKKKCTECKKKKVVTKLPPVIEDEDYIPYVPSQSDMLLAYSEINNRQDKSKRAFVNKVYSFLFNEDFDFTCESCVNTQTRKFRNYLNQTFKYNL